MSARSLLLVLVATATAVAGACGSSGEAPAASASSGASSSGATGGGGGGASSSASSGTGGEGAICAEKTAPGGTTEACLGALDWEATGRGSTAIYGQFARATDLEAQLAAGDTNAIPAITAQSTYSSVIVMDLNGDGLLDLFYNHPSQPRGSSMLYGAEGGTFTPAGSPPNTFACSLQADLDGNGWDDLFCMGETQTGLVQKIVWNEGQGPVWADPTLVPSIFPMASLAWDIDQDGLLDLVLSVFNKPNRVLRNRGDRTFDDVAGSFGLDDAGASWATAFVDFDADGQLDAYTMNDGNFEGKSNTAWRGGGPGADGEPTFEAFHPMPMSCDSQGYFGVGNATPMALGLGDVDGNGRFEAYVAATTNSPILTRTASGEWLDFRPLLALEEPRTSTSNDLVRWDNVFWDVDHDGVLDLLIAGGDDVGHATMPDRGASSCVFYHGLPCNAFELVTKRVGLDTPGGFMMFTFADTDGDLDQDLFVGGFNQPVVAYRNEIEAAGHHLLLSLVGTTSNAHGLGAQIRMKAGSLERSYQVGDHFAPQITTPPVLDLGIGDATHVDELRITWPSGYEQVLTAVEAGERHVVVEPAIVAVDPPNRHVAAGGAQPVTITVRPANDDGTPRSGATVAIDAPFQAVDWAGPEVVAADGSVSRAMHAAAAAGSAVVRVTIDGQALSVRPRVWFD